MTAQKSPSEHRPSGRRSRILAFALALPIAVLSIAGLVGAPDWLIPGSSHAPVTADSAGITNRTIDPRAEMQAALETVRARGKTSADEAIIAQVDQVGHWTLSNLAGETFTAADDAELAFGLRQLVPKAVDLPSRTPHFFITATSAFAHANHVATLPRPYPRKLVVQGRVLPIEALIAADRKTLHARLAPNLYLPIEDRERFKMALWQLEQRPAGAGRARLLSLSATDETPLPAQLQPSEAVSLTSEPANAYRLSGDLQRVRGQTILITGKRDGRYLRFDPSSGAEKSVTVASLLDAAVSADVNLLVVNAADAQQPGPRTLMLSESSISGLDVTTARASYAELLSALNPTGPPLIVTIERALGPSHVLLSATPLYGETGDAPSTTQRAWFGMKRLWDRAVSSVTGDVQARALTMVLRQPNHQIEMDRRLVAWLPSWVMFAYLGLMAGGLLLFVTTDRWWRAAVPAPRSAADMAPLRSALHRIWLVVDRIAYILVGAPILALPAMVSLFRSVGSPAQ